MINTKAAHLLCRLLLLLAGVQDDAAILRPVEATQWWAGVCGPGGGGQDLRTREASDGALSCLSLVIVACMLLHHAQSMRPLQDHLLVQSGQGRWACVHTPHHRHTCHRRTQATSTCTRVWSCTCTCRRAVRRSKCCLMQGVAHNPTHPTSAP